MVEQNCPFCVLFGIWAHAAGKSGTGLSTAISAEKAEDFRFYPLRRKNGHYSIKFPFAAASD